MSYDKNLWNQVLNELKNDKSRAEEMKKMEIPCQNNNKLRFYEKVVGSADPSGYALIICLHGGGQGASSMNDSQWKNIIPFESGGFAKGTIAVAPRGLNNAWNLHFIDESYPVFTRLIENYIIFRNVDPNRVYLMGFSAGGDGTYQVSERIPYMFAACSPQAGHPNGVSTINLCNLPTYLAAGEKDKAFKRNQICVDYYKKIIEQNGKYCGNYIAKVEVVAGSGHSFQCWRLPRKSFFNGSKEVTQSKDTAFTFMYSYRRNPNPPAISCDVKTFLRPLRNYYTQRGNCFYNIEVGKNPCDLIQLNINYGNNTINVKEGNDFRINLVSSLFKKGNAVSVTANGKTETYHLQKDNNYAKSNMKLFCDPNFGYDSYIDIGKFNQELKLAHVPKPPSLEGGAKPAESGVKQPPKPEAPKPAEVGPKKPPKSAAPKPAAAPKKPPKSAAPKPTAPPKVVEAKKVVPVKNPPKPAAKKAGDAQKVVQYPTTFKNPAQHCEKGKNGNPYIFVKLTETQFAWANKPEYWKKQKRTDSLMGQDVYFLNKVFYMDPKAEFFDIPRQDYFLLIRHNACRNLGLNNCKLTVKVDGKDVLSKKFFDKNYKNVKNKKGLYDDFIMNIKSDMFNLAKTHEILVTILGEKTVKKNWELDGFILIPDNCGGNLAGIYNQYFENELFI